MITKENAEDIWNILSSLAGARDYNGDKSSFIRYLMDRWDSQDIEWRFCGELGFGGKFRYNHNGAYVDCYQEDMTAERSEIIKLTNQALDGLRFVLTEIVT